MLSYLHSSGWILSLLFYVCFNMLLSLFVQAFLWFYYTDYAAATAAKSLQSLCDPTDGSPPGSAIPGILQARTLDWVAISFSDAWKWKVKEKSLSHVWLFATPQTAASQAPPAMGFSRRILEWGAIAFSILIIHLCKWLHTLPEMEAQIETKRWRVFFFFCHFLLSETWKKPFFSITVQP